MKKRFVNIVTNKTNLDEYIKYLNPHAIILLKEYKKAIKNELWACAIILSLTIIDNIIFDQDNLDFVDGLDINKFKNSHDYHWLRLRRNQILHYEGPKEGFYGSKDSINVLKQDAIRTEKILKNCFTKFFI